jgi:hemerythrin-like metal-binding protein
MPLFTWDASYSVGIKDYDDHHKHLFDLINQLHDAMIQGRGNMELGKIVKELVDYTQFHFSSEEAKFAQFVYPETTKHRAEHNAFKAKVMEFQAKITAGQIGLSIEVANFLKEWLLNHIKIEDKKYSPFLKAKGV